MVALEPSTFSSKGRWQCQPRHLARSHPARNWIPGDWMPAGWMPGPLGWVGHLSPHCMAPMPVLELPVLELPVLEVAVLELPVLEVAVLELPAPELQQMPCTARI